MRTPTAVREVALAPVRLGVAPRYFRPSCPRAAFSIRPRSASACPPTRKRPERPPTTRSRPDSRRSREVIGRAREARARRIVAAGRVTELPVLPVRHWVLVDAEITEVHVVHRLLVFLLCRTHSELAPQVIFTISAPSTGERYSSSPVCSCAGTAGLRVRPCPRDRHPVSVSNLGGCRPGPDNPRSARRLGGAI